MHYKLLTVWALNQKQKRIITIINIGNRHNTIQRSTDQHYSYIIFFLLLLPCIQFLWFFVHLFASTGNTLRYHLDLTETEWRIKMSRNRHSLSMSNCELGIAVAFAFCYSITWLLRKIWPYSRDVNSKLFTISIDELKKTSQYRLFWTNRKRCLLTDDRELNKWYSIRGASQFCCPCFDVQRLDALET